MVIKAKVPTGTVGVYEVVIEQEEEQTGLFSSIVGTLSPLKKISKGKSEGSTEDLLEKDN
jgi:hypothetical protein